MGATQSSNFPYEPKDTVNSFEGKTIWKLQTGTKKVDNSNVSIFSFDQKKFPTKAVVASNAFKRYKTLRHPYILPYIDGIELPDGINIVTESVVPLEDIIEESRKQPQSLAWGIYQIAKAISFLNNDCNLLHGNLSLSSVFVNKAGDWKLGGLDLVSSHKDTTSIIRSQHDIMNPQYKPLELQKGANWSAIDEGPSYAVDAWMLACFIYEVYNGKLTKAEDLKKVGNIPEELLGSYKQMLSSSPKSRLNPSKFLESEFFDNEFVETCLFLETIALKEPHEKDKFFKSLEKNIDEFPQSMCKYKILPQLVIALDYGSANSRVLGPLLKIGKYLTQEEYTAQIAPSVVKWFASPDRTLRMNLLQNLEHFVDHLSNSLVNDQIFPNVANGFIDPSPALRDMTVKSMLLLVPKLSERMINTQMLKFFAKLQMDTEPGIRTNTTICLANIATHLTDSTRQKILAPAFCRALRDPFPRARVAGIKALQATEGYYNKEDMSGKIIATLATNLIDTDKEVRDCAFQTIKMFVKKLEKISETGVEERVTDTSTKADTSGVMGWAFSSITKKIYGETPQQGGSTNSPTTRPDDNEIKPTVSQAMKSNSSASFSKGWSDDEKEEEEEDNIYGKKDDDNFTNSVYVPKKPLPSTNNKLPTKSITPTITAKTTTTTTTTKSYSLKPQEEEDGWKDNGWDVDVDDDDIPPTKSTSSKKEEPSSWDVDIEEDDWEDDDNWDFAAKAPSKLDMAKQRKQEKGSGKSD